MIIKDLMPILPKYYDNSGFDVVVTVVKGDINPNRLMYKLFSELSVSELNSEVIGIECGKALAGGERTEELHLIIKE